MDWSVQLPALLFLCLDVHSAIPLRKHSFVAENATVTGSYLDVLEVMDISLSGGKFVLYLDPTLGAYLIRRLIGSSAAQARANVIVDLSSNASLWCEQQTSDVLGSAAYVHIFVFQTDPLPFLRSVSPRWNPKHLLLFSGGYGSREVLLSESLERVERLALMAPLLTRFGGQRNMGLFSFYPFSPDDPVRLLGSWGSMELSGSLRDIFTDRFETFEGYEFQLATWFDDRPYLYPANSGQEDQGDGVVVEMLRAMATTLNYTYRMTPTSPDDQWGSFQDGAWNGMLGMVHRREKNFTVNYFVITSERAQSFDASVSYWMEGFGISLLLPPPLPKWRGFYYPLQVHVWFGVVLTLGVTISLMTLQDRWQPRPFLKSFGRAWIYFLRLLFNQSLPTLPSAHSQRVFVGCWCFYCFIVTTAYTANLVAFLTIPVFPKRIQTVRQLAESDFGVAMVDYGEFVPGALKSSGDPYYRTLGKKLELQEETEDGVDLVRRGTHALIESYSFSKIVFVAEFEEKNTYMLREQLYPGHLCWYFPKNTAWKYKFDSGIQRLVEAGLITRWIKLKIEDFLGRDFEKRQEMEAKENKKSALTFEHLQGVFFILVMSWLSSVVVFISELILGKLIGRQGSHGPRAFIG